MQHERRHNPYPWTWEIPLAVACAVLLVLAVGVHLGNAIAQLATGHPWTWPPVSRLFTSIPTTLNNSRDHPGVSMWIIAVEVLLVAGMAGLGVACWQWWGPARLKGMATREQTERVLGVTRLKKITPIVRPDLHPQHRTFHRTTLGDQR